jgi:hypothetical protein
VRERIVLQTKRKENLKKKKAAELSKTNDQES